MKIASRSLLFVLLLASSAPSIAQWHDESREIDLPRPELLNGMRGEWVAENIRYNGMPARIMNFSSEDPVDELFIDYERKWRTKGNNKVARSKFNGMDVLGIGDSDAYFTIQARNTANGGSEGSLIVSQSPLDAQADLSTDFPLYPNSDVVSVIESIDAGLRAETIISVNSSSVHTNAAWLEANLRRDGWQSQQFGVPNLSQNARQLNFQKQRQLVQVTIVGDYKEFNGKTAIVINWMK